MFKKKKLYAYIMKYLSAMKKNGMLIHATARMDPVNILSKKKPDIKCHILYDSIYIKHLENAHPE